jgi:DNA-binding NarL/FixJ family response regulator
MITLVFADDHPIARAGIRAVLSAAPDIGIIGEAENGVEVQHLVAQLRPQILLLDLKMPGPPPAEIERWVRTNYPETATLVLTAHDRDVYLVEMMDAGAAGLLNKESSAENLIGAIRRVAKGEILFDSQQLNRAQRWRKVAGEKWNSLTERERQVLRLLVRGLSKVEIADQLDIRQRTVDYHINQILKKLKVKSIKDAMSWMYEYLSDDLIKIPG